MQRPKIYVTAAHDAPVRWLAPAAQDASNIFRSMWLAKVTWVTDTFLTRQSFHIHAQSQRLHQAGLQGRFPDIRKVKAATMGFPMSCHAGVQVPLSVSNGQLFGTDGRPVTFKGINWFGFETANTLVDGLWQGPTALTQDLQTVAYRISLLGFNAIRLPFSFQVSALKPHLFTDEAVHGYVSSLTARFQHTGTLRI